MPSPSEVLAPGYGPADPAEEPLTRQAMRQVAQFIPEVGGATDGEECARLAGCSYGHLQRVFRDFHGSYLKPYIDDCRVARADALAREGWKQQDIAAYFGQSPSSFRQWYKRAARQRPF